jgi:hypothetical protein
MPTPPGSRASTADHTLTAITLATAPLHTPAYPLPLAALSVMPRDGSMRYTIANLDPSGRIADRSTVTTMGWHPGTRLDFTVIESILLIRQTPTGTTTVCTKRPHLSSPPPPQPDSPSSTTQDASTRCCHCTIAPRSTPTPHHDTAGQPFGRRDQRGTPTPSQNRDHPGRPRHHSRSSSRPAARRDHCEVGRPSSRNWSPSVRKRSLQVGANQATFDTQRYRCVSEVRGGDFGVQRHDSALDDGTATGFQP